MIGFRYSKHVLDSLSKLKPQHSSVQNDLHLLDDFFSIISMRGALSADTQAKYGIAPDSSDFKSHSYCCSTGAMSSAATAEVGVAVGEAVEDAVVGAWVGTAAVGLADRVAVGGAVGVAVGVATHGPQCPPYFDFTAAFASLSGFGGS